MGALVLTGAGCGTVVTDHDRPCADNPRYDHFYFSAEDSAERLEALRGVTEVLGDVVIGGDVANLEPMACLRSVSGRLSIETNYAVRSLDGLERLEQVGDLHLAHLPALTEVDALANLHTATHGVWLEGLGAADDLTGLAGLSTVSGLVYLRDIADRAALGMTLPDAFEGDLSIEGQTLPDLSLLTGSLRTMTGQVQINGAAAASAVDLSQLEQVDGVLSIIAAGAAPLPDLSSLHTVTGPVSLTGLDMPDMTPLAALERAGHLSIHSCPQLQTLEGLQSLRDLVSTVPIEIAGFGGGGLSLVDNPALTDLSALGGLEALTPIEGQYSFVFMTELPALTSVAGTKGLVREADFVHLGFMPSLTTLSGWEDLTRVPNFTFDNTALPNLDGLSFAANATFGDAFQMEFTGNADLTDISALVPGPGHLVPAAGLLQVESSPALGQCQWQALVDAAQAQGFAGDVFADGLLDDGPC